MIGGYFLFEFANILPQNKLGAFQNIAECRINFTFQRVILPF